MASVTAFSGNVPVNYETYLGPLFFEPYAIDLVNRLGENKPRQMVLEIACGTGRVTKHLDSYLPQEATLVATDLNSEMLNVAKQVVKNYRVKWQVADVHELPFEEAQFDLVVCQFGVMFFQDKPKALKEIRRVLQPGGTFLFNTWDDLQYNALSRLTKDVLTEEYPDDPPLFLEKGPYSLTNPDEIKQLLADAGFTSISIELVSKTGEVPTAREAVNGIIDGTPNYVYITERGIPASVVKEKLTALLTDHFGDKKLSLPMQAFVAEARKP